MGGRTLFTAFVGNLSFRATEKDIMEHFKDFNPTAVRIPISEKTGGQRNYAFVRFSNAEDVKSAIIIKDGSIFKGRTINVSLAKHWEKERKSVVI